MASVSQEQGENSSNTKLDVAYWRRGNECQGAVQSEHLSSAAPITFGAPAKMIKRFKLELETEHGDINLHGSLHVRGNALLVTADGRVNCHGPTLVADNLQIQARAAVQLSGLVRIRYQLSIDTADDAVYAHHARIQAQILKINATHGPIILDDVSQICDAHISTIDAPIHVNIRTINSPGHTFIRLHTTNAPISLHLSCDFYGSFTLEADQIDIQEPNKSIAFENDKHGTVGRLRGRVSGFRPRPGCRPVPSKQPNATNSTVDHTKTNLHVTTTGFGTITVAFDLTGSRN